MSLESGEIISGLFGERPQINLISTIACSNASRVQSLKLKAAVLSNLMFDTKKTRLPLHWLPSIHNQTTSFRRPKMQRKSIFYNENVLLNSQRASLIISLSLTYTQKKS